jgi:hypothetical protein
MNMKYRFDNMRKIKFWSMLMLMGMLIPLAASCGGDDDGDGGGSTDGDLIAKAVGTWMCTQSTDTQQGQSYQGLMVGKEVTINANGTYTSTASTFGYTGTYTVSGNKITAHSNSGGTFVITVSISGERMTWNGTASNGVSFNYVFEKEDSNMSQQILPFTQDLIAGDFQWCVESVTFQRGSNNSIYKGKSIRFYTDGKCEGFHSMETAWRITAGRIETYYAQTNEPMYTYTLLSQKGNELTVRIDGTLDDNLQATLVLSKEDIPANQTAEDSYFATKENIFAFCNACYADCASFEIAQYNLEKLRVNNSTVHNITPTSSEVRKAWEQAYLGIRRANTILDNENSIANVLSSSESSELIAQIRGIRAFIYYNVSMLWGDVPLIKTANYDVSTNIPQSKQGEVLQFANTEISDVIARLPESSATSDKYLFTNNAGRMLRAELELTLGNSSKALSIINQIDAGLYVTTRSTLDGVPGTSVIWALSIAEGNNIPVYTYNHLIQYTKEASGSKDGLETEWQSAMSNEYGYWTALKRLGKAQSITGCYDYELLMPIPYDEIIYNPMMTQNPGY